MRSARRSQPSSLNSTRPSGCQQGGRSGSVAPSIAPHSWSRDDLAEPRRSDPCPGKWQNAAGNRRCMQRGSRQPCRHRHRPTQARSEESHKPRSLRQFRPRLLWSDEVQRDLTPSYAPDILSDELDACVMRLGSVRPSNPRTLLRVPGGPPAYGPTDITSERTAGVQPAPRKRVLMAPFRTLLQSDRRISATQKAATRDRPGSVNRRRWATAAAVPSASRSRPAW
jgi:hypothetical protein